MSGTTSQAPDRFEEGALLAVRDAPLFATVLAGADVGDVVNVVIQLSEDKATPLTAQAVVTAFLSDDIAGDDIIATAPTSTAIGTDGNIIAVIETGKSFLLQCDTAGKIDLDITQVGAKTSYLVVVSPLGKQFISNAIVHAA